MDYADGKSTCKQLKISILGGDMALKIQELQTRNKGKPEVAKDYFSED